MPSHLMQYAHRRFICMPRSIVKTGFCLSEWLRFKHCYIFVLHWIRKAFRFFFLNGAKLNRRRRRRRSTATTTATTAKLLLLLLQLLLLLLHIQEEEEEAEEETGLTAIERKKEKKRKKRNNKKNRKKQKAHHENANTRDRPNQGTILLNKNCRLQRAARVSLSKTRDVTLNYCLLKTRLAGGWVSLMPRFTWFLSLSLFHKMETKMDLFCAFLLVCF